MSTRNAGKSGTLPEAERDVLNLSPRECLLVLIGVAGLLVAFPMLGLRKQATAVEPDYRIPYPLSHRYRLYRQYTTLASLQYPALVVGDSIVWGQCALRNRTLSHYLNDQMHDQCFANAGIDAMHPIALEGLLEYHAPSITKKSVLLQFNPLWLMSQGEGPTYPGEPLKNRPNLVPRLARGPFGSRELVVEAAWSRLSKTEPWNRWVDRVSGAQLDFLAWSLSHPYESPLKVLTKPLPPSEDTFSPRLLPWNSGAERLSFNCSWPDLRYHGQWLAFERLLDRLENRGNRVLVIVGPINEHMLTPAGRESYHQFVEAVAERLRSRQTAFHVPQVLASDRYGDICHPLDEGYAELARNLLGNLSSWFNGVRSPRSDLSVPMRK